MARSSKASWLEGPGDLQEAEVHDVPVKGESVKVRGLPAQYSNDATSRALEMKTLPDGSQVATVNTATLERLQFEHGVIEPKFSAEEVEQIAKKFGPAFKKVIGKVDELSGVDKKAMEDASTRFPAGGSSEEGDEASVEDGPSTVGSRPPVPSGTGA